MKFSAIFLIIIAIDKIKICLILYMEKSQNLYYSFHFSLFKKKWNCYNNELAFYINHKPKYQ